MFKLTNNTDYKKDIDDIREYILKYDEMIATLS